MKTPQNFRNQLPVCCSVFLFLSQQEWNRTWRSVGCRFLPKSSTEQNQKPGDAAVSAVCTVELQRAGGMECAVFSYLESQCVEIR